MKRASLYHRDGTFFIQSDSRTIDGLWVGSGPCHCLSESCSDDVLGIATRRALSESRMKVAPPRDPNAVARPLLDAAGIKAWKTFARTASCVALEDDEKTMIAIPTQNKGTGFEHLDEKAIVVDRSTSASIGEGVRRALQESISASFG